MKVSSSSKFLLGVHLEVDERVDGRVGHGKPEEGKEDVLSACVSSRVLLKHI